MSGAFKAVGDVAGGLSGGIGKSVGGLFKGAGQVLTGHPIKGLKSAIGGVAQGAGSVVKGGLGAVKNVAGDPMLMGIAGLATFGLGGAIAAPLLGKVASSIAGTAEQGVSKAVNLDGAQNMMSQNNQANFGDQNAFMSQNVGQPAPFGGAPAMPQMGMTPQYGVAPGATSFS